MKSCNVTQKLRTISAEQALSWNKYCGAIFLLCYLLVSPEAKAQDIRTVRWPELQSHLATPSARPLLVNFWATWCKPCVQELPMFLRAADTLKGQVDFLFVSMDFEQDRERKLVPFVTKRNFQSPVWLLNETDYNAFIDKVHPAWSGAIPATLLLSADRKEKLFFEKEYHDFSRLWQDISGIIR